ncbi:DUF4215 domain-containing protein [Patescibacteria group bacterium]
MFKNWQKFLSLIGFVTIIFQTSAFAATALLDVGMTLLPADATLFQSTPNYNPGAEEIELTWITSTTSNATNQVLYIDDGLTIFTASVSFPGPGVPDSVVIPGLIPGWTYTIRHVTEAGILESEGVWTVAIPAVALPAPFLFGEDQYTLGTENTLYWTNGGVDDPLLECRVTASLTDLDVDPNGAIIEDSGWIPCPTSTVTYEHTFLGLTQGAEYFYHVQTQHPVDGLSPFSNVESSTQYDDDDRSHGGGDVLGTGVECGDLVVESGEECDDGNTTDGDGCSAVCTLETVQICGNSVLEAPEQCDDGNLIEDDGCTSLCTFEIPELCGNGIVQAPEECDDGNNVHGDGCSAVCQIEHAAAPECGDGLTEAPEQCDDGNLTDGDGCSAACLLEVLPTCGNAVVELPEECDDGNTVSDDGCSDICEIEYPPACGNAILEAPEECDDGNNVSFDGCSDICEEEEIVTVYLHIIGDPEHRVTRYYDNLPADERLTTGGTTTANDAEFNLLDFGAADSFRIQNTPNDSLIAQLFLYKPSIGSLDSVNTTLDNFGESWVAVDVITGTYDFALNGEAHLKQVLSGYTIDNTMDGDVIDLDFSKLHTQYAIAGDTHDTNSATTPDMINALDIATTLGSYKVTGANKNDLNKDESPIVNAIDIAILIWNYKKTGKVLRPPALAL